MKIIDLTQGIIYDSIRQAAEGASVDPSNVRKVVQGKRRSAGGHLFVEAPDTVKTRDVVAMQKWAAGSMSEREQKRTQTMLQKHEKRVRQEQSARKKSQTQQQRQQSAAQKKQTYESMRRANEYIRRQTGKQTGKATLTDLQALAQLVGQKKQKSASEPTLFNLSPKTLAGKTETELQQIAKQIDTYIKQDLTRRQQYAQIRAQQYHITVESAASEEMMDAMDSLTNAFERLRNWFPNPEGYRYSNRFKYREIYDDLVVDAQTMTADQIQRLADDLDAWMQEKRAKKEEELKKVYEDWKKSVYQANESNNQEAVEDEYKPIVVRWD